MKKLDRAQRKLSDKEKRDRERGLDPDRARTWFTFTDAEGPPR